MQQAAFIWNLTSWLMLNLGVNSCLEINDKFIPISTGFNKISRYVYSSAIFNMILKTVNLQVLLLLLE